MHRTTQFSLVFRLISTHVFVVFLRLFTLLEFYPFEPLQAPLLTIFIVNIDMQADKHNVALQFLNVRKTPNLVTCVNSVCVMHDAIFLLGEEDSPKTRLMLFVTLWFNIGVVCR